MGRGEGKRKGGGEIVRVMTFYCVLFVCIYTEHPESLNTLFFVNKRNVA